MSQTTMLNPELGSLVVVARLLDYPTAELQAAATTLIDVVKADARIATDQRLALLDFIQQLRDTPLLESQAQYVETFDRGRAVSLLLFEHVHGESRARGQAMVDLLQQYQAGGLELAAKELPDYIPLYLEYLATRSETEAAQGLGDVHPISALLSARLQERNSPYHRLFDVLLGFINVQPDMASLRHQVGGELRDDTPAALDQVWEEEMVNFIEDQGATCPSQRSPLPQTHTLHFRENL